MNVRPKLLTRRAAPAVLLAALAAPLPAQDLHQYWDSRCKSCHGDAGDFARRTLAAENGRLVGRHHRDDLTVFLRQHYLADDLVEPVTRMLLAQATTPPLFQQRCAGCHGTAAEFARGSLTLRDGVLTGKASGRPVADYLRRHGGLQPGEIPTVVATLTRLMAETGNAK